MSYYVLTTPLFYLAIVGLERIFFRRRFEQIKKQIPINLFVLTLVAGFLGLLIWFERHVDLCFKYLP